MSQVQVLDFVGKVVQKLPKKGKENIFYLLEDNSVYKYSCSEWFKIKHPCKFSFLDLKSQVVYLIDPETNIRTELSMNDLLFDCKNGVILRFNCVKHKWKPVCDLEGPPGPEGPQGPTGPPGPPGKDGNILDLCKVYNETTVCPNNLRDGEILIKLPGQCNFCKVTLIDICNLCKPNPPVEIPCDNFIKGFGNRYRSFGNSGGDEVYLGRGDLGVASNRVASEYTWNDPNFGLYNFMFSHSSVQDFSTETLVRTSPLPNTSPNTDPLYYPSNAGGLVTSLTGIGVNINDLNAFRIEVCNRDLGTTVIVQNLTLITANGTYLLPTIAPPSSPNCIIKTYSWPNDGSTPADNFTFSGQIILNGNFSLSQESSRVDIVIGSCPVLFF